MNLQDEERYIAEVRTLLRKGGTALDVARLLLVEHALGSITTMTILMHGFGLSIRDGQDIIGTIYQAERLPSGQSLDFSYIVNLADEQSWPVRIVLLEHPNDEEKVQTLRVSYYTPPINSEVIHVDWGDGTTEVRSYKDLPFTHIYFTEGTYSFRCSMNGQESYQISCDLTVRPPKPANERYGGIGVSSWSFYPSKLG